MHRILLLTAAMTAILPTGAVAQTGGDLIVMRRQVAPPRPAPTPAPATPTPTAATYTPIIGEYGEYTTTCGSATRSRVNSCIRSTDGAGVDPATWCGIPSVEQDPTTPVNMTTGCVRYEWHTVEGACSAVLRRDRTVTCQRIQGSTVTTAADSMCNATDRPAAYTLDDACAPKSSSCTLAQDHIIYSFSQSATRTERLSIPIDPSNPAAMRAAALKFCQGYAWATACQGAVGKAAPNTLQMLAWDAPSEFRTVTEIFGPTGKDSFPHSYSGACKPVF